MIPQMTYRGCYRDEMFKPLAGLRAEGSVGSGVWTGYRMFQQGLADFMRKTHFPRMPKGMINIYFGFKELFRSAPVYSALFLTAVIFEPQASGRGGLGRRRPPSGMKRLFPVKQWRCQSFAALAGLAALAFAR